MHKNYTSLGLMSGTSGDGVDSSIIKSNGSSKFEVVKNKYFEYDSLIFKSIHSIKEKIFNKIDTETFSEELKNLERKITLFHAKIIKDLTINYKFDLVGFHGQTIYHNSREKISMQLGDGKLLYQLTKKKIIFNFREKDIVNGGEGAPLTPIFHQIIATQKKINLPVCFLNIGGISNITVINDFNNFLNLFSKDIGPGNCLIDTWVRSNSDQKFDKDGLLASSGAINEIILEQAQELYANRINKNKASFDSSDFDISFARGLSIADGASTLTSFTGSIIGEALQHIIKEYNYLKEVLVCGGGRKNLILLNFIKNRISKNVNLKLIDDYGVDGDFVESQAFAFLAIRSFLKLPITYPNTTGCKNPTLGGELVEN